LNVTQQFLVALLVLLIVAAVLRSVWQRLGVVTVGRTLAALALAILAVLTIRTAWAFAYLRPDDASEFLVYAHGSPDVRVVMDEVETLSRRVSRGLSLDIGYTSDGSYPIMWYLRNYPNAVRLPNPAGRLDLDKSVILAGDKEWAGIEPFLGLDYFCRHYDFMWWPMQDYYGLNWKRVVFALTDPAMRSAFWDIIFRRDYRRYEQATGKTIQPTQWPQRNGFRFCVRRKVIDELWGEAAAPNSPTEAATGSNSLPGPVRSPIVDLKIASLGSLGAWNGPHGLAIDADGFLYVADTYNHRVVKLSPQGDVVYAWQSTWWRGLSSWKPNGCLDGNDRPLALGEGEFCEPWGVAVGPDGRVFVADTWNHRVQVFGPDGTFLHSLGTFGTSGGDVASAPLQFYGPRDVAVDEQGNLYVSDTGNKRIQLFDTDLNYLRAFGGPGVLPGRLDEPVGVAIGPDRLLYVADTWNQRIQVFTSQGDFVRAWPVVGWTGQSAANKPYIRVDLDRHIYATDPEGARVLLFDATGTMLGVVDFRLIADDSLTSPFGILPDGHGRLWISDAAGQRLLRLLLEDLAPTE
jgi:DNA-binding beta-propeller fold protein YncE